MLIVMTLCSILTGADCHEETLVLDRTTEMTPMACIAVAQTAMADYIQSFPNQRVTKFKCVPPNHREHRA
jgi:hypothetical protein